MKNTLTYKGFIGSVVFDPDDEILYGKIEGINDLIIFESDNVEGLKKAFQEAVIDYLALCKEAGKTPFKSAKGSFNVRISPELHMKSLERALILQISLNQLVQRAIENEINKGEKQLTEEPNVCPAVNNLKCELKQQVERVVNKVLESGKESEGKEIYDICPPKEAENIWKI